MPRPLMTALTSAGEALPGRGDAQPPADPVEEDHTVVCLQFPEGQAYRGLGQIQLFCCFCIAACLDDGQQGFHLCIEHNTISFII